MHSSATAPQHAPRSTAVPHPGWVAGTRAVLAAAAAALLTAVALVAAPSASAHDSMIGSMPEDGATVTGALDSVELSFSGDLKPIGKKVSLIDADGTGHDAEASVSRNVMTVDFGEPLPSGQYTLTWRVVSSDGHPIEGTEANQQALGFTVKGKSATSMSAPASTAVSTPAAGSAAAGAPSTSDTGTSEPAETAGGLPTALVWVIIAVAVVAAAGVVFAKTRRQDGFGK